MSLYGARKVVVSFETHAFVHGVICDFRPTSRSSGGNNQNNNGVALPVGLADDQAKDFDFEKTEMKYDSTGMFHWGPAKNLEDCILVGDWFFFSIVLNLFSVSISGP